MIESERLLLRPVLSSDKEQMFAYRSDTETNKFQGFIPTQLSEVDAFIAKNAKEINLSESWFQLVIIEKASGKIIGDLGIHFIGDVNQQCELGITISRKFHGRGFATEAMKAAINYLFIKLKKHRITGSVDPENKASIALLQRLDFRKEAHFKKSLYLNGVWVDDVIYGLLNEEWKT